MNKNERLDWIDAFKGWGMLLIVVGHVWSLSDVSIFYQWIFSFHVPLFFFAAGLTLQLDRGRTLEVMIKRLPKLLIPYLAFGLLGYLFYIVGYVLAQQAGIQVEQFSYGLWRPLWGLIYGSVGDGLLVNSPIWFLPALFLSTALIYWMNQRLHSKFIRYMLLLGCFFVGSWLSLQLKLPWSASSALCAAVFVQAGVDFKNKLISWRPQKKHLILALAFLLSLAMLAPINGSVGLAGPTVNQPVLFMVFAALGIVASLLFIRSFQNPPAILRIIGIHSMAILVFHMLIIKGVKVILFLLIGISISTMESQVGWGLLILGATVVFLYPTVWLVTRYFPWTLGQPQVKTLQSLQS